MHLIYRQYFRPCLHLVKNTMATNGITDTTFSTTDVPKGGKNKMLHISKSCSISIALLPVKPRCLHLTHTQAHKHLLPAAIILPCMFSCSVKSPSSQVPTHLLNPETACKSHPERKHSIKWKTYLHANGCFGGPLGSEASGPATIVYVRTSGCNAK